MTTLIGYSLLAFAAGVLLNCVPCVLPIIPLKIRAVLGEIRGDHRSRTWAAIHLLAGSLTFFLTLGAATALLGLTWGALFQSKIFILLISALLLAAAIATFTGWSPTLPEIILSFARQHYASAFFTGILAGLLSTPCAGPFLGSVLAFALTKPTAVVMVIFAAIGAGLAGPYVVMLMWPGLLERISFGGHWTIVIKQFLGIILFAGAIFFGRVLLPTAWHPVSWGLFGTGAILWAGYYLWQGARWGIRLGPSTAVMAIALLLGFWGSQPHLDWREFSDDALKRAVSRRQPVLIEFTAEWCLNCKVLDQTTYSDREVVERARAAGLAAYRIDMTDFNAGHKQLLAKYGGEALPFALLLDGRGQVVRRFAGMFSARTLAAAITTVAGSES